MLNNIKTTVIFLLWARFLQMLVCNQENQKHIRGLMGLLAVCAMLNPFHRKNIGDINQLMEERFMEQENDNDKITSAFWKNCEEMIDEEMNGDDWRQHYEEEKSVGHENEQSEEITSEACEEATGSNIKVQVLLK